MPDRVDAIEFLFLHRGGHIKPCKKRKIVEVLTVVFSTLRPRIEDLSGLKSAGSRAKGKQHMRAATDVGASAGGDI